MTTLHLFPKAAPALDLLLDYFAATPAELAQALDVHPRTVARWQSGAVPVPRAVLLALWGISRWGRSAVECDLAYLAQLNGQRAEALAAEVDALRLELARVVSLGVWETANEPTMLDTRPLRRVRG